MQINVDNLDFDLRKPFQELTLALLEEYNDQILSIVVFGSGTTGDWIRGKSDVDFIIVTSDMTNRREVENFTNRVLMEISLKHDLRLNQTCSAFKKTDNPFINTISIIESFMTFGKPFFVLSKDQIDTIKGKIKDSRIQFVTSIFDSIAVFAAKIKQTGSTIYGENLIKELYVNRSTVEKIKAMIAPAWLVLVSFIVFPIDAKLALSHSTKATFWACEDALFFLEHDLSSIDNEIRTLNKLLQNDCSVQFSHVREAIKLKPMLKSGIKIEKGLIIRFLYQTPLFIKALYSCTLNLWWRRQKQRQNPERLSMLSS